MDELEEEEKIDAEHSSNRIVEVTDFIQVITYLPSFKNLTYENNLEKQRRS